MVPWHAAHTANLGAASLDPKARISQSIKTRTRGESWRLRGYGNDTPVPMAVDTRPALE